MLLIPCNTAKSIWKSAETINQEIKDDTSLRVIDGHVTVKSPLVSIRAGPTSQVINRRIPFCHATLQSWSTNLNDQRKSQEALICILLHNTTDCHSPETLILDNRFKLNFVHSDGISFHVSVKLLGPTTTLIFFPCTVVGV